jgi:GxxExxY protein
MEMTMPLIHKELTHQIRGGVYEVFRHLGPGWDEETYHLALLYELGLRGLNVDNYPKHPVHYRGKQLIEFEFDLLVEKKIILELKYVHSDFLPVHYAQIISYLKAYQGNLGLLINFGLHKAEIKRVPFTDKTGDLVHNFADLSPLPPTHQNLLDLILEGAQDIIDELGPGYIQEVYERAMQFELGEKNLCVLQNLEVGVRYKRRFIKQVAIKSWLVENQILFFLRAGTGGISTYDIISLKAYIKQLGLKLAVICFFHKTGIELRAIQI